MFKIGEFSKLTQVSVRMLRYYDEMGLLTPSQIDPWTNYRLYSVDQIPKLNRIIYLRDSGFNIAEITAALKTSDQDLFLEQLDQKQSEIEHTIEQEKRKIKKIALIKKELSEGMNDIHYNITLKSVPSYKVLSLRRIAPTYYSEGEMWMELSAFANEHHITVCDETFSLYHDTEYKEADVDIELCAVTKDIKEDVGDFRFRTIDAIPLMASMMVYGEFSNIAGAYQNFAGWLQKNSQYQMTGPSRQIVHRGPWNESDPSHYLIELQIPLLTLTRC